MRSMMNSSSAGLTPAAGSSSRMTCRVGHQHARQFQKLALPAGEHARRLVLRVREREEVEQRARLLDRRLLLRGDQPGPQEIGEHAARPPGSARRSAHFPAPSSARRAGGSGRCGRGPGRCGLRRHRASRRRPRCRSCPAVGLSAPAMQVEQRRLARAVRADQAQQSRRAAASSDMPSTARMPPNCMTRPRAATEGAACGRPTCGAWPHSTVYLASR